MLVEEVAAHTGASPRTVQRVAKEARIADPAAVDDAASKRVGRPSPVAQYEPKVVRWLAEDPKLPSNHVLERLRDQGYAGSKTAVYDLVRRIRPAAPQHGVSRFDGLPGEFSQHDFGEVTVRYRSGQRERIQFFASVLKFSRLRGVKLVANQTTESVCHGLVDAFTSFGGLPLIAVFDNPKTIVLGDDPLATLAPSMATSLVAFLATERKLVQADLEAALGKEFGVSFAAAADGRDSDHFVVLRDSMAMVSIGGALHMLEFADPRNPPPADLERYQDLRIRRLLGEHRQLLRVTTRGPVGAAAEAQRRFACARVIAALWGSAGLGLSWHCDRRLIPASQDLPQHLRSEDPVAATLGERVVPVVVPPDAVAMQRAIAEARATWGEAVAQHRRGGGLTAKFPFPTRTGNVEHIWVTVQKIDDELVHGVLANEPHDLGDWARFAALHLGVAPATGAPLLCAETLRALHTPPPGADYAIGWGVCERPRAKGRCCTTTAAT